MDEEIKQLLEVISEPERVELTLYSNAKVTCQKDYNVTPSAANAKNLQSATEGLETTVGKLMMFHQAARSGKQKYSNDEKNRNVWC